VTKVTRFFWHNIGRYKEGYQGWWRYLLQKGQIAAGFGNKPGGLGERKLRAYQIGDVVIAYASKYGALGYGIIRNPSSYVLLSNKKSKNEFDQYHLHRLDISWEYVTQSIGDAINSKVIRNKFGLKYPRQTKETISSLEKVNKLINHFKESEKFPHWPPEDGGEEGEHEDEGAREGESLRIFLLHRKRDRELAKRKKQEVLQKTGALACEVCDFNFVEVYGKLGYGFAECHHTIPLAKLKENQLTKLSDLAIVCSNCHRMLHKRDPLLSIDELRNIINTGPFDLALAY